MAMLIFKLKQHVDYRMSQGFFYEKIGSALVLANLPHTIDLQANVLWSVDN